MQEAQPPLPHADIVSLLATGTTTAELGGNAEALASRAAMLAVKQPMRLSSSGGLQKKQFAHPVISVNLHQGISESL